jgi:hypothetical protein
MCEQLPDNYYFTCNSVILIPLIVITTLDNCLFQCPPLTLSLSPFSLHSLLPSIHKCSNNCCEQYDIWRYFQHWMHSCVHHRNFTSLFSFRHQYLTIPNNFWTVISLGRQSFSISSHMSSNSKGIFYLTLYLKLSYKLNIVKGTENLISIIDNPLWPL